MSKTEKNLKQAFAGESQAYQRYVAFAQRAADEFKEGIYKLFMAAAESESIHAGKHLAHLKGIRSSKENLQEAMAGESHEFTTMYPQMISDAREEKEKGTEITMSHASEVEKIHHGLFQEALNSLDNFPVNDYYICPACGYIVAKAAPDKCPVCGAVKKVFYKVV